MRFARDCGVMAAVLTVGWILAQLVEPLARLLDAAML